MNINPKDYVFRCDVEGNTLDFNITVGLPSWYYTLPLCTLWFSADSPTGIVCRDREDVVRALEQQHNLQSFVLVTNNDVLEFFRCGKTWSTGRFHLEYFLDEIEEKVNLARRKVDEQRDQDQLKCGIGLSEDQLPLQSLVPCNKIEDNDQLTPVE